MSTEAQALAEESFRRGMFLRERNRVKSAADSTWACTASSIAAQWSSGPPRIWTKPEISLQLRILRQRGGAEIGGLSKGTSHRFGTEAEGSSTAQQAAE